MSSFFNLILDTTKPIVEIIAPSNATRDGIIVTIQGNETLDSTSPEVYFIDSLGTRTDYILDQLSENSFRGEIISNTTALGLGVLYCKAKDDVWNESDLVTKEITILSESIYIDGMVVKHIMLAPNVARTIEFISGITELSIVNMGESEVYFKLDDPAFNTTHDNTANYLNDIVRSIDILKDDAFYTVTFVAGGPTSVQWDGQ
jgi:hypothetical protein